MRRLTLLAAAAVAGCTVGPNYRPPAAAVPPAYGEPQPVATAVDLAKPWAAFGDPVLTGLIERALRDNPDIAAAVARVRQARYQEIVARSAGKPIINADANATYLRFSKNAGISSLAKQFGGGGGATGGTASSGGIAAPGSDIKTFAVGFDASWELDLFGGVRRSVEGAVARTEAAEWNGRDAAVMIAAEVAQGYWALRLDQAQLAVVGGELERQQRSLGIAEEQAQVGLVPNADLTQQRATITTTQARAEPVRADLEVRAHALAILLGQAPAALMAELSQPAPPLQPAPVVPAGLPSDLLRRRPDVRAAERNLAAATADIGVAVADLYPRFSLTGMAQLISTALGNLFTGDSLQLTGSGAVQFPVLDWGRRRGTVNIRKAARDEAYADYRSTVLQALKDVEDALAQLDAERRRNATLQRAVNDASVSADARQAQYRTGFVTQNTLLDAEAQVLSAREQLAGSDAQLRQMTVALMKALGGGWEGVEAGGSASLSGPHMGDAAP